MERVSQEDENVSPSSTSAFSFPATSTGKATCLGTLWPFFVGIDFLFREAGICNAKEAHHALVHDRKNDVPVAVSEPHV